ncbi:MAG: Outer rane lipoprotein carrier protein LolA [Thermoanaerobaculia bacterium]|nr:Outer rane lipoprotein carrier protein LolA [Thermoanaerobaculia bacterium]
MSQSMLIRKLTALAFAAVTLALPVAAARAPKADSLDDVIRKVQLAQTKTNTLQADFRQEKTLALLSKPEVSTGRFVYSKPNNVLWTYDAPKRVTMLIANVMLKTYYPDLNKAERFEV